MTGLLPSALSWYDDVSASTIPPAGDRPRAADSKQPWPDGPKWERYQAERPSRQQVIKWFGPDSGYEGVGVVTGAVSGALEGFEFEGLAIRENLLAAFQQALADHGLLDLWKRIIGGYVEATPSGGMHTFYKVAGAARSNTKLAARPAREDELTEGEQEILARHPGKVFTRVLIETRGEGGYMVVAPSGGTVHPTGKPWVLGRGSPATIVTITEDERDALYAIASLLNQEPARFQQPRKGSSGAQDGGRPGDEFAAKATWKDILTPHGWEEIRSLGDGVRWWRRPGKDKGMSATTRDGGGLWVFTTSTEFEANSTLEAGRDKGYSKFAAYTVLNHRGDYTAAAAQLRREGYGADQDSADTADTAADEPWEPPVPLSAQSRLPAFPVEAFPAWLADEVREVARFTQTPPDLPASVALAVLGTAAGGRAVVEIRGSWREPVNVFTVVALPSGSRKSPVFAELTGALLATEAGLVAAAKPAILEAETQRKIALRDAEKAAHAAAGQDNAQAAQDASAAAIGKAMLAEAITVPVLPRLVADDITPEAASSLLAEQAGRLAVLSAEGGIFATLAGRYTSGQPNFEVFLKGHSGDMLRVDRKGRPPEYIHQPALTLGLCVQPEVLRDIAALPGFRGRGLLARILYSVPADFVGRRKIGEPAIPEPVRDAYAEAVQALTRSLAEWTDPAVLQLTPEAAELLLAAERAIEPRLDRDSGDLAPVVDWASKQIGHVARIAGLLHLAAHLSDGWGSPIGEDTMRAALKVGDYYIAHALAAFEHMGTNQVLEDARAVYRWLERTRLARFTKREAHMGLSRSRFPKAGDLDAPLDLLEQHGYIRCVPEPERAGPGRRPSPAYEVHPDLATETTESTESASGGSSVDYVVSVAPTGGQR